MPANMQKSNNVRNGLITGGIIGIPFGPIGVLTGASICGLIGKIYDKNNDEENKYINDGILKIVIWDVQHSSAIYIKTPNGKNIV